MTGVHTDARPIKPLPVLVSNQIAAGEVIERPASVVKELVDNALDAGATRISVRIERGGIELVEVSDDGVGIAADQLHLAVAPHATSKIDSAEDLERITTMGFRGEALASIASVSRLSMRSRSASEDTAHLLEIEGATAGEARPEAGPVGTRVSVRNLFFNTPARRKFLRTPQTEQSRCVDVVRDLALGRPAVGFKLEADARVLFDLPPDQGPRQRAIDVLGKELETSYFEAHADEFDDARGVALWGMVAQPALAKPHTRNQHILLNGRPVRDKTIQHALKEAYRGLTEPGRHPAALLLIQMDPTALDVNVHPAKSEVRFRDSGMIHSVVMRAVKRALEAADLTPTIAVRPGAALPSIPSGRSAPIGVGGSGGSFVSEFKTPRSAAPESRLDFGVMRRAMDAQHRSERAAFQPSPPIIHAQRVLQVHDSFLVVEDEQGIAIIDQHALHERVMFQKLIDRIEVAQKLESQRLLMPVSVQVSPAQIDTLESLGWLMEQLGIESQRIGPATIAINAFATLLFERNVDPLEFMRELLEKAEGERWDRLGGSDAKQSQREAALHEVLDMMACKAAVKAGDALSESELGELLALRDLVERSSNCPHGRPTTIRLTIGELERRFGRR